MAKLSIDNGMQVSDLPAETDVVSICGFCVQTDINTGMKIEESCYSQVVCFTSVLTGSAG